MQLGLQGLHKRDLQTSIQLIFLTQFALRLLGILYVYAAVTYRYP